jgi:phosphoglycerate dehydrogenase-like enzyme
MPTDQSNVDTAHVLFCTDTFWSRRGGDMKRAAPGLEVVPLVGESDVDHDALARVTIACCSADAWPDRIAHFFGACLDAGGLRWLHTFSAGVDHPIFGTFLDRGVRLTTSSGAAAPPIAQTVLMYLLALTRDLPAWTRAQAEHRWAPHGSVDLDGLSVGIVGMGPIGLEVARLTAALGMRPIGMRRTVNGDEPCETWTLDRLHELAGAVDALVVAIPLTSETRGLVDASVIGAMRPGAYFVNVGRGEVVDEHALVDALNSGQLAGAGLDVFAVEPLPDDSPLWDLPNVIVTPHSSGTTAATDRRASDIFVDNLTRYASGRPLRNEV